jgi:tetratricopeptide (TPR) repeat protein
VAIDRDATLKQAEKLLRQGKLDGAIEQYVRLLEEQPEDWNSINALGDLYLRAGKNGQAADQFIRIADHQFAEGFFPKSAALYKKALKVKPDDEHIFMQLAEIGERQGKFADAKFYLQKVAQQRQSRGEQRAAAECILRLGSLEGSDLESKIAAAKAAQSIGDAFRAVELLKEAANICDREKRRNESFQLLADAAEIDPFDAELRNRLAREFVAAGQPNRARAYLSAETAGDDPDLLFALATIEFADGKEDDARTAMGRMLALASEREGDVMRLAEELMGRGRVESAFACIDAITDAALLNGDVPRAAGVLQKFIERAPHIPALTKLVEISVDANMEELLRQAQGQLADAYLEASRGDEARVIAEDLVRTEPANDAHVDRLRRALVMLGVTDPEPAIAEVRGERTPEAAEDILTMDDPDLTAVAKGLEEAAALPEVDIFVYPEQETSSALDLPSLDLPLETAAPEYGNAPAPSLHGDSDADGAVMLEVSEIDLSTALSGLRSSAPVLPPPAKGEATLSEPEPPTDIEDVFAQMRAKTARDQQASAALGHYEQGLQYLEQGLVKEAITALESAVRVPLLRFRAAAQLGRIYIEGGDAPTGVGWLERAAEAPAPTPDEGYAVLYELAAALETQGESARALAILMELDSDAGGYRDVRDRIAQLTRTQTGSHSG